MAGLIEALGGSTGDPNKDAAINQGILQMGLQMLQSRGSFGQALGQGGMAGLAGFQGEQDNQFQQRLRQQQQMQWEDHNRQAAMQQKLRDLAPQYQRSASGNAMSNGQGPTLANAQKLETAQPSFDMEGFANAAMGSGALDLPQLMQFNQYLQKDNSPLSVAEGTTLLNRKTMKPVFSNPKSANEDPLTKLIAARDALPVGHPNRRLYDDAIKKATTHQPGTSVSVNTGQKGFDNTLKLRGDFRSEPIYKAHQEVQSAYSQIQQSLKQASPAGDLAGATKLMKLLDPGSVVRESELGMAMAASGALDRLQHYATNIVNGTKLTPTQRTDFQKLADALYGESVKQYNTKRAEYEGIAKRNELNVDDVLGAPSTLPASPVVNFADLK